MISSLFNIHKKVLPNTKKAILNLVASIFDPLGIVTPAVLEVKLIIQTLSKLEVDWDNDLFSKIYYNVTNNG